MVAGGWGLSTLTFFEGVSVVGEVAESQHIGYGFLPVTTLVPEVNTHIPTMHMCSNNNNYIIIHVQCYSTFTIISVLIKEW